MIRGRQAFLLNREPYSTHKRQLAEKGFEVVGESLATQPSEISRKELAPRFRHLTDGDMTTSAAFILSRKSQISN